MEKTDIFAKTAKGEEELAKRTYQLRIKQRSVLIMIDGRTSEAGLLSKLSAMGDAQAVLRELEEQGFIERKGFVILNKSLFDVTTINGMELRNRFVRSATREGMCDEKGRPNKQLSECFRALARGRVGLIITGSAYVRPDGKQIPGSIGAYTDNFAAEMKEVSRAAHEGGGKLCMQLGHCGGQAWGKTIAPSAVETAQYSSTPAEMSPRDIEEVIVAFGEGARRAKEWGFDAVQIHAAHGYLINQFLSPHTNRRTDAYGGSIEKRTRFSLEVYRKIRSAVGAKYPVLVKLSGSDFLANGLTSEDALYAAQAIAAEGVDAIEVSSGTPVSGDKMPVRPKIELREQEAYNLPFAMRIKGAVKCPVVVVGGLRSFDIVREIVEKGQADYVSLARPLIREPALVKRWQEGNTARAHCISCNKCYQAVMREGGLACLCDKTERTGTDTMLSV